MSIRNKIEILNKVSILFKKKDDDYNDDDGDDDDDNSKT